MDFTREPIIETIITPKDGCKLVIRSSKGGGQEEYFVDSIEVVTFGHAHFYRSLERPKSFLVPVVDYEVVEVREARMVLKNLGPDRSIKIGGGRAEGSRAPREPEKVVPQQVQEEEVVVAAQEESSVEASSEARPDSRLDKKRDRRRHYRKRKNGKDDTEKEEMGGDVAELPQHEEKVERPDESIVTPSVSQMFLLQPPPLLISETINRYRDNALFKNAFFLSEEDQYKPHDKVQELLNEDDDAFAPRLGEPINELPLADLENTSEPIESVVLAQDEEGDLSHSEIHEPVSYEVNAPHLEDSDALDIQEPTEGLVVDESEGTLPIFSEEFNGASQSEEELPLFIDERLLEKNRIDRNHGTNEIFTDSQPSE